MSVLSLADRVDMPKIDKSEFDLSYINGLTGYLGKLTPVYCEEVIPGDEFTINVSCVLRLFPFAAALNHRVDLYMHFFFVPNRIIWSDWEEFITGRSVQTIPVQNLSNHSITSSSIGNYFGIPQNSYAAGAPDKNVNELPLLAYIQIYNDFYRNKILQNKVTSMQYWDDCLFRNWRKDYFTSALPYPQLGNASVVSMSLQSLAQSAVTLTNGLSPTDGNIKAVSGYLQSSANEAILIDNASEIGVDVNDIRYAYAYQDWLLRMLQGGDDYKDHLKLVFGVVSEDARLQKAEYLGGFSNPIIVNEITSQTAVYDSADALLEPLGTQQSVGSTFGKSDRPINCYVKEHGYIIGIMSVLPKSMYYGGLPRHFFKELPLDFYFPQFAHLPEQEIYEGEVFFTGATSDKDTWGYIERYAEYKHRNDMICGQFAKQFDHFHFARLFTVPTQLNGDFVEASDIREDAFAVQNKEHFYGQIGFDVKAVRPMPFNVDSLSIS